MAVMFENSVERILAGPGEDHTDEIDPTGLGLLFTELATSGTDVLPDAQGTLGGQDRSAEHGGDE